MTRLPALRDIGRATVDVLRGRVDLTAIVMIYVAASIFVSASLFFVEVDEPLLIAYGSLICMTFFLLSLHRRKPASAALHQPPPPATAAFAPESHALRLRPTFGIWSGKFGDWRVSLVPDDETPKWGLIVAQTPDDSIYMNFGPSSHIINAFRLANSVVQKTKGLKTSPLHALMAGDLLLEGNDGQTCWFLAEGGSAMITQGAIRPVSQAEAEDFARAALTPEPSNR